MSDDEDPAEVERKAARADPRQTQLFNKRRPVGHLKGGDARRARNVPVTLAGKPKPR